MDPKQTILARLRDHRLDEAPLPKPDGAWTTYDSPLGQFRNTLQAVGGVAIDVAEGEHPEATLQQVATYREARKICSLVPDVIQGHVSMDDANRPHELEDVDFCIAAGQFAVAENAAVWVTDHDIRHRVIYFLAQHLALIVSARDIVHNLHEAYRRISFTGPGYGLFISGPSKTADIEQSLVIGAHGPRSLTVLLTGASGVHATA